MSVSRELLVIKNSKVLVTGKIIYMKYMCICMYFIHMCIMHLLPLPFTFMEVCTWDHSYKCNELQVEKVTYFFPMIEIMMLKKRTDFQITPGIFLKKAFKMETSVTSTAAAVEKPPVYSRNFRFLILLNIFNFSSFFLYLPYLSKYFYFFTFLLNYVVSSISRGYECESMIAHVKKIRSYFTKEFLDLMHWGRNLKFHGKSWELYCYQASYCHFYGKASQFGLIIKCLKTSNRSTVSKGLKVILSTRWGYGQV